MTVVSYFCRADKTKTTVFSYFCRADNTKTTVVSYFCHTDSTKTTLVCYFFRTDNIETTVVSYFCHRYQKHDSGQLFSSLWYNTKTTVVSYSCRTDNTNTNFFYNRKTRLLSENESLFSKVLQCRSCGPGYRCILKRVCFYHMMSLFFCHANLVPPPERKEGKRDCWKTDGNGAGHIFLFWLIRIFFFFVVSTMSHTGTYIILYAISSIYRYRLRYQRAFFSLKIIQLHF